MKVFLFLLVLILLGGLGYGGWMYLQQTDDLNQTRATLTSLNGNLLSLQQELTVGQANVASLQAQLTNEKAKEANLEAQLNNIKNQQSASDSQVVTLKSDLESSKAKINSLQSELAAAQALNSGTQAEITAQMEKLNAEISKLSGDLAKANTSLDKANAEVNSQKALVTSLQANLAKVKDPRHFYTIEELNTWLQQDDTNSNPAFAAATLTDKAFILQVRALRDGYLLPAAVDADSEYIYSWNVAVIGAEIYVVTASTDAVNKLGTVFQVPPAQRPLPLPTLTTG